MRTLEIHDMISTSKGAKSPKRRTKMKIYTKEEAIEVIGKFAAEVIEESGFITLETGEDYMDVWELRSDGRLSVISR